MKIAKLILDRHTAQIKKTEPRSFDTADEPDLIITAMQNSANPQSGPRIKNEGDAMSIVGLTRRDKPWQGVVASTLVACLTKK